MEQLSKCYFFIAQIIDLFQIASITMRYLKMGAPLLYAEQNAASSKPEARTQQSPCRTIVSAVSALLLTSLG